MIMLQLNRKFIGLLCIFVMNVLISEINSQSIDEKLFNSHQLSPLAFLKFDNNLYALNTNKAATNYLELEKLYIHWSEGLFGSRKYYRRLLIDYLINIVGEEILTDYNYIISSPEGVLEKELQCRLFHGRWLKIIGDIDADNISKIAEHDTDILKKWWRTRKLIAVNGTIRDFRLDRDSRGYTITLYLDNIRLKDDNIRKNSGQ
ncbi:MAG: hypothetical protein SVZ03_13535 [Spirochaetota bacterium]|nr:hypothetical protein [Spirochaetota bacterium]